MAWNWGPIVKLATYFQDRGSKAQTGAEKHGLWHGGTPPYETRNSEWGNAPKASSARALPSVAEALATVRTTVRQNEHKQHMEMRTGEGFSHPQQPIYLPRHEPVPALWVEVRPPPGGDRDHRDDPSPPGWGGGGDDRGGPPHPPGPPPPGYKSW